MWRWAQNFPWVKQGLRFQQFQTLVCTEPQLIGKAVSEWLSYLNWSAETSSRRRISGDKGCPPNWRCWAKFMCLCLLLWHYQIPHSWHLLQILLQSFLVRQNRLDLLNLSALSVGVTNCQCSSEEEYLSNSFQLVPRSLESMVMANIAFRGSRHVNGVVSLTKCLLSKINWPSLFTVSNQKGVRLLIVTYYWYCT